VITINCYHHHHSITVVVGLCCGTALLCIKREDSLLKLTFFSLSLSLSLYIYNALFFSRKKMGYFKMLIGENY
jgi:hypothetical protein